MENIDALCNAHGNAVIALYAEDAHSHYADKTDWPVGPATAWPTACKLHRSTDQGDELAENYVRNVRAGTNEGQFASLGLEKNQIGKQALSGPIESCELFAGQVSLQSY